MRRPGSASSSASGRLTVVALTGRERLVQFVVEDAEDPAATLAAELRSRGLGAGRLRLGLDRRLAVVKAIELPQAAGGDLARMVGFDLERHVPFPPEQTRFDWVALPGPRRRSRARVLVGARPRRARWSARCALVPAPSVGPPR